MFVCHIDGGSSSEPGDALWLKELEDELRIHGARHVDIRDKVPVPPEQRPYVPLVRGYITWTAGFRFFGLTAILVIYLISAHPSLLMKPA